MRLPRVARSSSRTSRPSAPTLLQEVQKRADDSPTTFKLLIPNVDAKKAADWPLSTAIKLRSKAADGPVEGRLGGEDAFESVSEVVAGGSHDEIIISTLPEARSE